MAGAEPVQEKEAEEEGQWRCEIICGLQISSGVETGGGKLHRHR